MEITISRNLFTTHACTAKRTHTPTNKQTRAIFDGFTFDLNLNSIWIWFFRMNLLRQAFVNYFMAIKRIQNVYLKVKKTRHGNIHVTHRIEILWYVHESILSLIESSYIMFTHTLFFWRCKLVSIFFCFFIRFWI